MTSDNKNKQVICIFERDLEDVDKSQLICIYSSPDEALKHIEESKDENLFWEPWEIQSQYTPLSNIIGRK